MNRFSKLKIRNLTRIFLAQTGRKEPRAAGKLRWLSQENGWPINSKGTQGRLQDPTPMSNLYFGLLIDKIISIYCPILCQKAIKQISMIQNIQKHNLFFFPQILQWASNVSVQKILRPKTDQDGCFSGKHGFHCLKMQVTVGPQGLAVDIRGPFEGIV